MKNTQVLLLNTAVLTATGFLMRTVAVAFNVYLTNRLGAAGIGLFQLIMSVYALGVTFASAGVKLSAIRLATDSLGGEKGAVNHIMNVCLRYGLCLGTIVAACFYLLAPLAGTQWIMDERAVLSLRLLAFSLPPIAMSSALSGYFTARRTAAKYAVVQLLEQLTKIVVTTAALSVLAVRGLSYACAAVSIGMSISEMVSFSLSMTFYRFDRMRRHDTGKPYDRLLHSLMRIAMPDAVGSWLRSSLLTIEHLLIPVGFRKSGTSSEGALAVYGTIHGMALPVVLYPSAILTSLAGLLVPELARLNNDSKRDRIGGIIDSTVHYTLLFCMGTAGIMFTLANEISLAVYGNTDSTLFIRLLCALVPVMYLDMIVDGLLKGLDEQVATMRYNIIDSAICVVLVWFLLPKYSVRGYIFILFISEIINFYLSIGRLIKVSSMRVNLMKDVFKPLLCIAGTVSVSQIILRAFSIQASSGKLTLALHICAEAVLYLLALRGLGCIKKGELKKFLKTA